MPLESGTKLGPYEILAPLGAGGMGEVYRARDPRLGREVAVKVLPHAFAKDRERLQRFEHEARAAGALNHPGITAIYDVGSSSGIPYIVTELLEGESLRTLLAGGPLPPARAADLGIQAAQALATAHAKGIVHRDLKPENLHVLPDGRLKMLDFGLAKLTAHDAPPRDETGPQLQSLTVTGTILGTASYMAPEQVRDQKVDHRADLFALGAILYELASGKKAFPGETPADRMTAILTRNPEPLAPRVEDAVPGLEAVIRRCLEKRADDRFDSARDLAFTLETLVHAAGASRAANRASGARDVEAKHALADARFRQLTFREGLVAGARFASDGRTVVYGAAWGDDPHELYLTRIGSHEPRSLGVTGARLLAVTRNDEIILRLRTRDLGGFILAGVLGRMPLMGGVARELVADVYQASVGKDGRIAAVRVVDGSFRLEYPLGTVIHETDGWMSEPQVLDGGEGVFVFDHPAVNNNGGYPALVAPRGIRHLSDDYFPTLAGSGRIPGRREILISGQDPGGSFGAFFVSLDGGWRPALRTPGWCFIEDVSATGDVLMTSRNPVLRMEGGSRGEASRDLSWLDWTIARDMTPDGTTVLFDETGVGVSPSKGMVFIRRTDGSAAVPIAEGIAGRFSSDGGSVIAIHSDLPSVFDIVPIGIGESTRYSVEPVRVILAASFPDRSICIAGHEPGRRTRVFRFRIPERKLEPLTEEGSGRAFLCVAPDGRHIYTMGPNGHTIYSVEGGAPRVLEKLGDHHRGIGWSPDGRGVYVFERGQSPVPVQRVDIASGTAEAWLEIKPRAHGVRGAINVCLSADGERYVTSYPHTLSDLYVIEGLFSS